MTGRSAASAASGHSPKGGAASSTASPAKPSVPNASRRRTFKSFDQAPRDGTPFHIPMIVRFNPFARTFEALYRDQFSGELSWKPEKGIWRSTRFCDLLPLSIEPPKSFAMTFVATPVPPKTWRERLTERLFGWLRVPDTMSLMQYCWQASAMSTFGQDAEERLEAKPASATAESGDAQ